MGFLTRLNRVGRSVFLQSDRIVLDYQDHSYAYLGLCSHNKQNRLSLQRVGKTELQDGKQLIQPVPPQSSSHLSDYRAKE